MAERVVEIQFGESQLPGILTLPEKLTLPETLTLPKDISAKHAVVIAHGWGTYHTGPHDMIVKLARTLATNGITALRFDLTGRGESEGDYNNTALDTMIENTKAAADYLRTEHDIHNIDALGLCSGANVALGAAVTANCFADVFAISMLPYQSHKPISQERRRKMSLLRTIFRKALSPKTWWRLITLQVQLGRVAGNVLGGEADTTKKGNGDKTRNLKDSKHDIMNKLTKFKGRIKFIWGGKDDEGLGAKIHFEDFAKEHKLQTEFSVIEGANHNFYSKKWEDDLIAQAIEFFTNTKSSHN